MIKLVCLFAMVAVASAGVIPAAPLVAAHAISPAIVTARSSQVVARNYNTFAAVPAAVPAAVAPAKLAYALPATIPHAVPAAFAAPLAAQVAAPFHYAPFSYAAAPAGSIIL